MRKIFIVLILVVMVSAGCPPRAAKGDPDTVLKKNGWELRIWITAKGTRSEGRVSRLYRNGKEICPQNGQTRIDAPLGQLKYEDSPYLWGWHGWEPKEIDR